MSDEKNRELERFASDLMKFVRDRAIDNCDLLVSGRAKGPDGERWMTLANDSEARAAVQELLPDIVDATIFEFLNAIDNDELPLLWRQTDGSVIDLSELGLGEMGGWFMGSPSWRSQFSERRYFDPLADLKLELDS